MQCQYIREQRHVCGEKYQEVDLFPVTRRQHMASPRAKKELASSQVQKELNRKNSNRHFAQKAHTNFGEEDFWAHFTCDNAHMPQKDEDAAKMFDNFIRRLNNHRHQLGVPPCKYMAVMENKGVRKINYHFHVIMDGQLPAKEIKNLWAVGRGRNRKRIGLADISCIDLAGGGGTINRLCSYMTKDPSGKKRWTQSRGLKQPERPRPNDGKYSRAKLAEICKQRLDDGEWWAKKYPGWELAEPAFAKYNDMTGWSLYAKLRATLPRGRPKEHKNRRRQAEREAENCKPKKSDSPATK